MGFRRDFLATATGLAAGLVGCAGAERGGQGAPAPRPARCAGPRTTVGPLSGKTLCTPDVNAPPMPALAPPGIIYNGKPTAALEIDPSVGHPDVRSFKKKFGLLLPATNTSMEHELWGIVFNNQGALAGVGLHTTGVSTPRPRLRTEADLLEYKRQFLSGLGAAVGQAMLGEPEYLIMGMSLEHILPNIDEIRALVADVESRSNAPWAAWHDAAAAALNKFGAERIGLLTPFDRLGNENASSAFRGMGFDVVASVGFACESALHIAHIPDSAKERAVKELLATKDNRLDAVVQCGTNMSMVDVCERLEPSIGMPVLSVNATLFWYALRENGFGAPLARAGRLLREF